MNGGAGHRAQRGAASGFTLMEVLVSTVMLSLILAAISSYMFMVSHDVVGAAECKMNIYG